MNEYACLLREKYSSFLQLAFELHWASRWKIDTHQLLYSSREFLCPKLLIFTWQKIYLSLVCTGNWQRSRLTRAYIYITAELSLFMFIRWSLQKQSRVLTNIKNCSLWFKIIKIRKLNNKKVSLESGKTTISRQQHFQGQTEINKHITFLFSPFQGIPKVIELRKYTMFRWNQLSIYFGISYSINEWHMFQKIISFITPIND